MAALFDMINFALLFLILFELIFILIVFFIIKILCSVELKPDYNSDYNNCYYVNKQFHGKTSLIIFGSVNSDTTLFYFFFIFQGFSHIFA